MRTTHPDARRPWTALLSLLLLAATAAVARAHGDHGHAHDHADESTGVTLERPVRITTVKADRAKTRVAGHVVAYDDAGFRVLTSEGKTLDVRWDELAPPQVYAVHRKVLDPHDGRGWVRLGEALIGRPGGQPWAGQAFAQAQRVDPKLRDWILRIKGNAQRVRQQRRHEQAVRARTTPAAKGELREQAETETPLAGAAAAGEAGPSVPSHVTPPPKPVKPAKPAQPAGGDVEEVFEAEEKAEKQARFKAEPWPKLNVREQADCIDELNLFAEQTERTLRLRLRLRETRYFLFYSDLPQNEADKWAVLLDKMYAKLAKLFDTGVDESGQYVNVWRGKALVFVFANPNDYRRFQIKMHDTNPGRSVGMCHSFHDGTVHIAFYRQPDEMTFAHVLVHESVHGFLHRYRTPEWLPSWVNEGVAEVIAAELVPQGARQDARPNIARGRILENGGLKGMLDAEVVTGWQYPVSETLCSFMISQSKDGFVDFIDGIKDGLTWEQSLEQRYGVTRQRLVKAYGESLGLERLAE